MNNSRVFIRLTKGVSLASLLLSTPSLAQDADNPDADDGAIVVVGQRQAYIGDFPVQDIPQNVQSLSTETLDMAAITQLSGALDLVSGVSHLNNFGGLWDSYAIRGFSGDVAGLPSGFLVNGFNGARGFGGPRDTSSVERIDVLKGPTSALFGRGEPGGTVNIVTKKPEFRPEGYVLLQGGSWKSFRAEADYTTPVSDDLAFRINAAYDDAGSFRDTIRTKKFFVTPSVLWQIGDRTSVSYEMEFSSQEIPFDRGLPIFNNDFDRLPVTRFLGEPGDGPIKIDVWGNQVQFQHDFSDDWSLLVGASYRKTRLRGTGEYPELVASRQPFFADGTILSRQRRYEDSRSESLIARAELTGHFDVGALSNTLVVGIDYDYMDLDRIQTRFRPPAYVPGMSLEQINGINVLNPVYGAYTLPNPFASTVFDQDEVAKSWGAYFYDQIDLTEWLKVRVGGRYDEFRQTIFDRTTLGTSGQNVSAFSPQAGLVIQPTDTLSFYGSFGRGFRPNSGQDFFGNAFAPEKSESYEVGAKYALPGNRLTASLALFTMTKTNILTADPNPERSGYVIAVGGARSRGVEVDVNAKLPYNFNVMLAYSYVDAFSTSSVLDPDFGKAILPGDPLINVAKHSGNVMLTKEFEIGGGKSAMIGGGVQYVGKRLGETATDYFLPAVTLVRLMASVDVTENLRISGNVENLFDKRWFANSYSALWTYPGAPRRFTVRATYRF